MSSLIGVFGEDRHAGDAFKGGDLRPGCLSHRYAGAGLPSTEGEAGRNASNGLFRDPAAALSPIDLYLYKGREK